MMAKSCWLKSCRMCFRQAKPCKCSLEKSPSRTCRDQVFFCAWMVLHFSILFHFSQPWVTLDTLWRVAWVWTEDSHRCWGAFVDYKHSSPNPFSMLSIPKLATFRDIWWYLTWIWHFFRGPRQTHARRNTWRRKSPPRCHGESPPTGDPRYRLLNNYWAKKPYITIQYIQS